MADGKGSLRQRVINALKLHREGRHEEALGCASQMLFTEKRCALLMNLLGDLLMEARSRIMQMDPEMAWNYLEHAVKCYETAANDAPNCIHTSASYAAALLEYHRPLNVPLDFFNGVHTNCPDDPFLHHAAYALDKISKEQRMHYADEKWSRVLTAFNEYISKSHLPVDDVITTFFTWMDDSSPITGSEIFAYAENISFMFPSSTRARYLPNYVALHLVGNCSWNDKKSVEMLEWALKNIREESVNFSRSLIFALVHVKLLLTLGRYDAAERECYRALGIEEPDDPSDHDIPLGSTSGQNYSDRVSEIKNQIRQHIQKVVLAAQFRWRILKKDDNNAFLSMRVEDVMEHYRGIDQSAACTISEALLFFEANGSWGLWICPYFSGGCSFKSTSSGKVYLHLVREHLLPAMFLEENVVTTFQQRLEMHLSGHGHVISFSRQPDMFFFRSFDDMLESFFLLSNGDEKLTVQELKARRCGDGVAAIEIYRQEWIDLNADNYPSEVQQVMDLMEKLWVPFLQAFLFDYRDALLPLLASLKWEELKKCLEDVTAHGYYDRDVLKDMFVHALGTLDCNLSVAHDPNHFNGTKDNLNAGATEMNTLETSQPDMMVRYEKGRKERDVSMEICNNLNSQIDVNKDAVKLVEPAVEEILRQKVPARAARLHSSNQATRYGFEALHRPMRKKVVSSSVSRLVQIHDEEQEYYRSNDKLVHQEYYRILLRAEPLHVCSICFFDRATINPVNQVLYHYQIHEQGCIRCELCSARFSTESLLLLHKTYCHEPPGPSEEKRFRWSMKQGLIPSSRKEREKPG